MHTMIGEIDEARLTKKVFDTGSNEWTSCTATEWYLDGVMVRRDGNAQILKFPDSQTLAEI